jgi:hypothetical protein
VSRQHNRIVKILRPVHPERINDIAGAIEALLSEKEFKVEIGRIIFAMTTDDALEFFVVTSVAIIALPLLLRNASRIYPGFAR